MPKLLWSGAVLVSAVAVYAIGAQQRASGAAAVLAGSWSLDLQRSHYGASAEPRRAERFDCTVGRAALECRIRSEYASGRIADMNFSAPLSGAAGPVHGLADADSVRLVLVAPGIADATFSAGGRPVLRYRVYRAGGGRALTIVAVDPVRRTPLTSVVQYDRAR